MKQINITIGRFQPFTQGHLNMILEGGLPCIIYRINSSDRDLTKIKGKKITRQEIQDVLDFVQDPNIRLSEREKELLKRPFSNELIEKELDIVKNNYKKDIIDIIYVKNAYEALEDFQKKVENGEYEPHYLMCGDDRIDSYMSMVKRFPGLDGIEPNKGSGRSTSVSGSLVRKSILEKDKAAFDRMMPNGTGQMFGEFCEAFDKFLSNLDTQIQESKTLRGYLKMIYEGGAAGHMAHPYDYDEMTGKDICNLIGTLFSGNMEHVKEKMDGTNIYATMNTNGEVVFIRNKGDLNSPNGGMSIQDMMDKWSSKPEIQKVFVTAGRIITEIFNKLGIKYFNPNDNTRKVINCECIVSGKTNVMIYEEDRVVFHGYVIYKKEGDEWVEYKKVEGHVGDLYQFLHPNAQPRPDILIQSIKDAQNKKKEFINQVQDLFKKEGLTLNSTLAEWKLKRFNTIKPEWMNQAIEEIYNRWFNGDKSFRANELKKLYPDHYDEFFKSDHIAKQYIWNVMQPLDELFTDIGCAFMDLCSGFINANCKNSVIQGLRADMRNIVGELFDNQTDPDIINRATMQMNRIGDRCLNATEGVVFTYKGKLMKLTGTFAALNQLMGLKYKL